MAVADDNRLRTRTLAALARAGKPFTVTQIADQATVTRGAALTYLRQAANGGQVIRLPAAGHPAPYLDRYTTPPAHRAGGTTPRTTPTATPARAAEPQRSPMLAAALDYAARGWHVFPLRPGDKRPAFPAHADGACDRSGDPRCRAAGAHVTWEQRATTDPDRITRAWTTPTPGRYPYGIGIACGPSGLVVIDLDQPKLEQARPATTELPGIRNGGDAFTALCASRGEPVPWETYTVTTTRAGTHLYFTHPGPADGYDGSPLRNTAGDLGWLIDTRAHGGYVVAPPTTLPSGAYTLDQDTPVATLPTWLAEALAPAPRPAQVPTTVHLDGISDTRRRAYLEAALQRSVAAVLDAEPGRRNRALYGAAVALGQLVAGGELTAETATAALEAVGVAVGQSETEARATVASGMRAGRTRPRTITTTATVQEAA